MEIVLPSLHYKYMQPLVLGTVCSYCNIHEFNVPAGGCVRVASVSLIPVQCVLKHCGLHKHNILILYYATFACAPKQS